VWFAGFSADTASPGGEGTVEWTNSYFGQLGSDFTVRGEWADLPWGDDTGVGTLDWRVTFADVDGEEAVTLEVIDVSGGFGAFFLVNPETRVDLVVRIQPTEQCLALEADDGANYELASWPAGWSVTSPLGLLGPDDEQITPSDDFAIKGEIARGTGFCGPGWIVFADQIQASIAP
jgi:hypothetical protein